MFKCFIPTILKSLVVPVIWMALIDAIYSRIAPFFALNRIFFPANEEATLKTKQPISFVSKTLTFSPQKMDEFSDRLSQVLHQQNIWTDQVLHLRISKWM